MSVMTFDFNGGWSPFTNFNSPLFPDPADPTTPPETKAVDNIDGTVHEYEAAGVPADKILISVPFYGHLFSGVGPVNDGLFQPFAASTETPSFATVESTYLTDPSFTLHRDPASKVPWLYSPTVGGGTFISYDDVQSIARKAQYVRENGLRGAMFWELSNDDTQHTLVDALSSRLTG
jgi:chitinase